MPHVSLLPTGQLLDPSAKRPNGDLDMVKRLPVMRLSMVVQRLIEMERRVSRVWSKQTALPVICKRCSSTQSFVQTFALKLTCMSPDSNIGTV